MITLYKFFMHEHKKTLHMIGRDNQSEEYWLNNKIKALLSQTKTHHNEGKAYIFSAFLKADTTNSRYHQTRK